MTAQVHDLGPADVLLADGSIAVASETVSSEWGRIQTRYAVLYTAMPAPGSSCSATVAALPRRVTTTSSPGDQPATRVRAKS